MLSAAAMAIPSVVVGQVVPADTVFFDYDFTANDQMTAQVDASGIFTGVIDNRGPFADGPLESQLGWNSTPLSQNMNVDTAGGFARETATSPTNYPTSNLFIGQPLLSVGDTVRLISEISFTKNLIDDGTGTGTLVEGNSQFDNYFFGFRGGAGTNEFAPNDGVSHSFRYNIGTDNTTDSDSNLQVFVNANAISSLAPAGDGNVALVPVNSIGIDIANNDFETDVFRIVSDCLVTGADTTEITFEITTSVEDAAGTVLATTPAATTVADTAIVLASNRIQVAIRDGNSAASDPSDLTIHRLAVVFNPDDGVEDPVLKGDVDLDGVVTFLDISPFIDVLSSNGFQDEADCDCDGAVTFLDIQPFIDILAGN